VKLLMWGHWSDTGFGVVTKALGERFVGLGIDVRVLAVNHRGEPVRGPLQGRVWPTAIMGSPFGANIANAAVSGALWRKLDPEDDWAPDIVLAIADPGGLINHMGVAIEQLPAWMNVPVFHYCPIEGDNLSLGWRGLWEHIQPVAMSTYGQRVISEHIGRPVPMVYHGVDTETFRPIRGDDPLVVEGETLRTQRDCRRLFNIPPEAKVILRTDRNVVRKFYYRMFEALPDIFRAVPDSVVVLHCSTADPEGINLIEEHARMPAEFHDRVRYTQRHDTYRGLSTEGLVALMNAADVYMSTTGGEGFGLTLAESMACEVPVVVTDWAADREVVGPGGVLVPPTTDQRGEVVRYHSQYGMDWAVPDAQGFVGPVVDLLTHPSKRRGLGKLGRMHVRSSFSWDTAAVDLLSLFSEASATKAA
jgi:glycosyltransferase involved in cell wall biosynthesis